MDTENNDDNYWTQEKSLKLINEYRRRPVLWYKQDPMYMNETFYIEAWLDIGNTMGINHNECIKQMSKILLQYEKEKNKYQKAGVQTEWFAWNALTFLYFQTYEKLKLVTGNHYYSEQCETEIQKIQDKFKHYSPNKAANFDDFHKDQLFMIGSKTPEEEKPEVLEDLQEMKRFAEELVTKMKKYPTELRNRIKKTIAEVFSAADEEYQL